MLSSFAKPLNVAVIGASGGIGRACVEILQDHEHVGNIYAFARAAPDANTIAMDICDEQSIQHAIAKANIDAPIHVVLVATGLLHDDDMMPEKALRDLDAKSMRRLMDVNAIGPALIAKHFIPLMPRDGKSVFAALSARVGSISDNRLGGWHGYRASKAALNMIIKNIAIETARKYKHTAIIGLHPGTVDTRLSSPFQNNVKNDRLFSPQQSAEYLLDVIDRIDSADTGKIFAWDGREIPP